MPGATTRLALPYPLAADSPAGHTQIQSLATALDVAVIYGQGLLSARPAAAIQGRIYFATDNSLFYLDTGSAWVTINTIADGSVTNAKLAADAVTAAKIAADAVGSSEIAALAVGNAELAALAVDAAKIAASLKPSGGAAAGTEALRALGTAAGTAAAGIHAAQHAPAGADALDWQGGIRSAQVASNLYSRSTNQSIPNSTDTAITFDGESANKREFATGLPASTIVVPRAGWYTVTGQVEFAGNATGTRIIWVTNGGVVALRRTHSPNGTSDHTLNMSGVVYFALNANVQLLARQTSGGGLNVQTQTYSPLLTLSFLSA